MMRPIHAQKAASLTQGLAALQEYDITQLRKRFLQYYGVDAPLSLSTMMLRYAVAYQMQVEAYGGISPHLRKQLQQVTESHHNPAPMTTTLASGTRLLRSWHGKVHEVLVQEKGVLCNGATYRSLSEVARIITGTHCSGPRFFGLHSKGKAA